ncbi:MAG TPA: tetratricopeptide repeat protein [Verrucomicrobiae bacterium]|jgi:tetratricopeptide (TPR) repeat protein|nr:tetratricopeptide repeat protein [Verrucomicrobiae bacterium]
MSRPKSKSSAPVAPRLSRRRAWCFRILALLGAPLVILGVLELILRVAGFGYPAAFLLPSENHGQKTWVQNNQFGWRFFGAQMARLPQPISIPQHKAPGTIRIFVFGESAAFGDPQPRFGLPRMLQAILELRHPGAKFEVVNAAMTGINSHTIVPIARDCARAGGDVWVIYMGNNEVVGPFGAGTVFGPQAPPLPVIRASLDLKATRTGQLFDSLAGAFRPPPPSKSEWGGMTMFLNQRIRSNDPRMPNVYRNFERNLADILQAGHDSGAGIVLSTVAVNLKDCAPFASLHRTDLSAEKLADWDAAVKSGAAAEDAGDWQAALSSFSRAAEVDDTFAELRYRMGRCALALREPAEAVKQFTAARDLDALRFRCDTRLNEIIRQAGVNRAGDRILFADAERAFAEASPDGLPGADLFYEHVHLTFAGNYLLASVLARQVEQLLPSAIAPAKASWPEMSDCAARLARTDRDAQLAFSEILSRLADPPFTWQLNHPEQLRHLAELSRSLAPPDSAGSLQKAQAACESAIARFPDDPLLHQQLAELKQAAGDQAGVAEEAQRSLDLLPGNPQTGLLLGLALAQQQKYEEAATAFRQVFQLNSEDVWARQNFALCLQKLGRKDEAIREFKRALAIKPRFGLAYIGLGQLYEEVGRTNEAAACYQKALANPIHRTEELTTLARFCASRKWFAAASTNYLDAIKLSPSDANLRVEAGQTLVEMGRHVEAGQCFAEACRLSPGWGQAHFLCGLEYGRAGKVADAEREFREAVKLLPDLAEARLNLGIALYQQQKFPAATEVFQEILQHDPANATALKYLAALRGRSAAESAR